MIIHNADFDLGFINAELARIGRPALVRDKVIVTERIPPTGRGSDISKTTLLSMTRDGLDISLRRT